MHTDKKIPVKIFDALLSSLFPHSEGILTVRTSDSVLRTKDLFVTATNPTVSSGTRHFDQSYHQRDAHELVIMMTRCSQKDTRSLSKQRASVVKILDDALPSKRQYIFNLNDEWKSSFFWTQRLAQNDAVTTLHFDESGGCERKSI